MGILALQRKGLYSMSVQYEIKTNTNGINFEEVREILHSHGLSEFDTDTQKRIFENSYAVVFIMIHKMIIGVGRAISDGISQAAIYNIAIRDAYKGNGLGKVILDELLKQVEGCNVILYTHPKHVGLYEHWGFSKLKTAYALYPEEKHYREEGFIE